jgi:hypothetical protein
MQTSAQVTKRRIGLTGPVVLILLGGAFLASNFDLIDNIARLWPLALIGVGVAQLIDRMRR